jgi:hypothetical protein
MKGKTVTISNFQVQNIIKAYRVQSAVRSRVGRDKAVKNVTPRDEVVFSAESKKRVLAEKITQGLMQELVRGGERNGTVEQALARLSQEYGKDLNFDIENEETIVFKAAAPDSSGEFRSLSLEDNQNLKGRFFDITKTMIYDNII